MEHSKPSRENQDSAFRLERRPMPTQSQRNAVATSLLKLKRQIDRLPDGHRQLARIEAMRQLNVQNDEELIKDEERRAHK